MRRKVNTHGLIITACRARLPICCAANRASPRVPSLRRRSATRRSTYRPDEQRGPIRHKHRPPPAAQQYCDGVNDAGAYRREDPALNKHL